MLSVFGLYNADIVIRSGPLYDGSSVVAGTERSVILKPNLVNASSISGTLFISTGIRNSISSGKMTGIMSSDTAFPYNKDATASALPSAMATFMGCLLNSSSFFFCSSALVFSSSALALSSSTFFFSSSVNSTLGGLGALGSLGVVGPPVGAEGPPMGAGGASSVFSSAGFTRVSVGGASAAGSAGFSSGGASSAGFSATSVGFSSAGFSSIGAAGVSATGLFLAILSMVFRMFSTDFISPLAVGAKPSLGFIPNFCAVGN